MGAAWRRSGVPLEPRGPWIWSWRFSAVSPLVLVACTALAIVPALVDSGR